MHCLDARSKLDAFVDTELPPRELVEVARHVAECVACDASVKQLMALHDAVCDVTEADASGVDLRGVWGGVEAAVDAHDASRQGRQGRQGRMLRRLPGRSAPLWAAGMAMAAGVMLFMGAGGDPPVAPPMIAAGPRMPVIERYVGVSTSIKKDDQTGAMLINLGSGRLSRR
jgi:anti-sigma factor RsiW